MKKTRLHLRCLLIAVLLVSIRVSAQDPTYRWRRPNVVKTNLLAPVSLFYERVLMQRFALQTSIRWLDLHARNLKPQNFVNATLEARWYTARLVNLTAREHPSGFFVNPYVKARSIRIIDHVGINPDVYEEEQVKSVGLGMSVGYQWVTRRGWVFEVFHGGGVMPAAWSRYRRSESDGTVTTQLTNSYLMMDLRSGVSVGYAF